MPSIHIPIKDYTHVYNCIEDLQANPDKSNEILLEFASHFIDESQYIDDPFAYTEAAQELWIEIVEEMNQVPRVLSFTPAIIADLESQLKTATTPSEISHLKERIEALQKRVDDEEAKTSKTMYGITQQRFKRTHKQQQLTMHLWLKSVATWAGVSYVELCEYPYLKFIELANMQSYEENLKHAAEMDAEKARKDAEAQSKAKQHK